MWRLTEDITVVFAGVRFGLKVGQIGPKWDKSGDLFQIRFSTFWRGAPKCTEFDMKKIIGFVEPKCTEPDIKNPRIGPIWGQSDPLWVQLWWYYDQAPCLYYVNLYVFNVPFSTNPPMTSWQEIHDARVHEKFNLTNRIHAKVHTPVSLSGVYHKQCSGFNLYRSSKKLCKFWYCSIL